MLNICIFEDECYTNFLPLVYTRPVYDLICGFTTLREKISRQFSETEINLHCRDYIAPLLKEDLRGIGINKIGSNDDCLFVNGRIIPGDKFSSVLSKRSEKEVAFLKDNELIAVRLKKEKLKKIKMVLRKNPEKLSRELKQFLPVLPIVKIDKDVTVVHYLWDLVNQNAASIIKDAAITSKLGKFLSKVPQGVHLINKNNIYVGREVKINPGVVIDAEEGPVIIEDKVKIFPQATIIGPVYIGEGSILKTGAQIYEGTTIGKVCKVGGEVEESVFYSYSNKQHHGFLGHSYLGSWVNLGAGTTNSDLKNNYGPVKVYINGEFIDSGLTFVGLFIGDHSKSGINSAFNTGTIVGVSCNLFGSTLPPKYIPSFSWGGDGKFSTYQLDKALETAQKVMSRRKKDLSRAGSKMLEKVFNLTKSERKKSV